MAIGNSLKDDTSCDSEITAAFTFLAVKAMNAKGLCPGQDFLSPNMEKVYTGLGVCSQLNDDPRCFSSVLERAR